MSFGDLVLHLFDFDIKTIILLTIWGNVFFFILLNGYNFTLGTNENRKLIFNFALSKFIQAFAWLFIFYRTILPDFLSVNIGNSILFAGYFLESITFLKVIDYKNEKIYWILNTILILSIIIFNLSLSIKDTPNIRVVIASFATFSVLIFPTIMFFIKNEGSFFRKLLGFIYALFLLALFSRGVNGIFSQGEYIFSTSFIQKLTFLSLFLMTITGSTGLLLLIHEGKDKKIKKLLDDKDKFLSIIAHDLRSPFQGLIGLSEILKNNFDELDNTNRQKFISMIYDTADLTNKLLDNLLNWATIQQGNLIYNPSLINLNEIIRQNIAQSASTANSKQINVSLITDTEYYVFADKNLLETIVRNLMVNAIKFSHVGGKIEIAITSLPKFAVVSITDEGVGIEPDIIENLFNTETYKSTRGTTGEKGTGLGLKLCREFVEIQGGTIKAESISGIGSKFIFTVPLYLPGESKA